MIESEQTRMLMASSSTNTPNCSSQCLHQQQQHEFHALVYSLAASTFQSHQSLSLIVEMVSKMQAPPHRQRSCQRLPALPSRLTLKGCSGTKPLKRLLLQLLASLQGEQTPCCSTSHKTHAVHHALLLALGLMRSVRMRLCVASHA